MNENKIQTSTIVRTVALILALINQILSASGKPILPIEDTQLEVLLTTGITVITALIGWWKDNPFTQPALESNKLMKSLKEENKWNA